MNLIKCMIVDDEALARTLLSTLVKRDPDLELIGMHADGNSALTAILNNPPDLLLLDIQMPVMTGLQLTEQLLARNVAPYIIFITAFDQYAIKAFELNALDYLVKPIEKKRFNKSMHRAKQAIRDDKVMAMTEQLTAMLQPTGETQTDVKITMRKGDEIRIIVPEDIVWVEAANQYVLVHTKNDKYLRAQTLSQFSKKLSESTFIRVHRSSLINLNHLCKILKKTNGSYRLVMSNDNELQLARSRLHLLDLLLQNGNKAHG